MNWQMKAGIGIFVLAVIALVVILVLPPKAKAPTTTDMGNAAAKADLIKADSPQPGATIASPLNIAGQARGNWYFEASFPYQLLAADGTVIAQGPVQAQSDWMTTNFVPFLASIDFPAQPSGSKGMLLLKKDNPSGDPSKDDSLIIPVVFQ